MPADRSSTQKPTLSSEDIAFMLAPRLNAAGRLGPGHAGRRTADDRSAERAGALAAYLDELNASRESLERSIYLAANKQATEAVRSRRGRGAGAGRPRLASGRDRHRGRAAGREVPPAGGADRLRHAGRQAGHRLGPQRAGLQSARGAGRLQRASGQPRRPRGGGRIEDRRRRSWTTFATSSASTPRPRSPARRGWPSCGSTPKCRSAR